MSPISSILITILAIVSTLPIFWKLVHHRRIDIFEPINLSSLYFFLLFVLRPIYDLTLESEFLGALPFDNATESAFNLALLYAVFGFIAFLFGYYLSWNKKIASSLPNIPRNWDTSTFNYTSFILLAFGIFLQGLLIQSFGGFEVYLGNKQETLTAGGQGYLSLGLFLINFVFAAHVTQFLTKGSSKITLFLVLLPCLLLLGFISGSKGQFINPLLCFTTLWNYLKTPIRPIIVVLGAAAAIFLFPIFNIYRHTEDVLLLVESVGNFFSSADTELLIDQFMSRFHTFDSLVYAVRDTPKVMDFQYGQTILPLIIVWIPRQLWVDKPTVGFGKIFAESYYVDYFSGTGTSASVGIIGEGYINFHVFGVLLFPFIFGIFAKVIYIYFIQKNSGLPALAIYSTFILYILVFWEADVSGFLSARLFSLVCVFSFVWIMGRHPRKKLSQ